MKRQTALALAAVFAMSVAGTALAAPNAFADVPAKHWAYDSIKTLAQAGVISGYGDNTFKGDKTLTRYEMAVLVAKAMNNSDKMDAQTKAALDKLQAEFGAELNNLGVRVENLEKKSDNVKVTGDIRYRYKHIEHTTVTGKTDEIADKATRSRVTFTGKIDNEWSYTGRIQNTTRYTTVNNGDDSKTEFNMAYVTGKVLGGTYNIGKQDLFVLDGLVVDNTADSKFKGVAATYDLGAVKATARYGKQVITDAVPAAAKWDKDAAKIVWADAVPAQQDSYAGLELKGRSGQVDLGAAYHDITNRGTGNKDLKIWEVSSATKISPVFTASAAYAKSDADNDNKAYTAKLRYKDFNMSKPGSFAAWAQYRHTEVGSLWGAMSTYDETNIAKGGSKALEIGFDYAPWKNVKFETWYVDAKSIKDDTNKDKFFGTYVRYYF